MKRKNISFLLISLLISLFYFILTLSFNLPFKKLASGIILFDITFLSYLYTKKGIKNITKFSLFFFLVSLILTIINYFFNLFATNIYFYLLLCLDLILLVILYLRKSIKRERTFFDKFFKFTVVAVPLIIIFYIAYANMAPFGQSIGFVNEPEEEKFLTANRITSVTLENLDKIALAHGLVYFDKLISSGTDKVNIKIRFYNNFPENNTLLRLGAKDQEDWHYQYKTIYNPLLDSLNLNLIQEGSLKLYQKQKKFNKISNFLNNIPTNVIIATDQEIEPKINLIKDYKPSTLTINTTLRGTHNFFIYIKGNLKVDVIKKDINWYENEDILNINLYSSDNALLSNSTIQDDGIIKKDSKTKTIDQAGSLIVNGLQEGVYRLELNNNADMIIKRITINQNKIVTTSLFLADNEMYDIKTRPIKIYTKTNRNSDLVFNTYHKESLQKVKINNQTININKRAEDIIYNLKPSNTFYELTTEKNDIIISSTNYFSFTKDSYFEPFKYKIVPIKNNKEWLINNVDYIYTDYATPKIEGNWIIGEATFNVNETYIKNNKLNFLINAPHLSQIAYQNYTIPIDYVNTTFIKDPIRWK